MILSHIVYIFWNEDDFSVHSSPRPSIHSVCGMLSPHFDHYFNWRSTFHFWDPFLQLGKTLRLRGQSIAYRTTLWNYTTVSISCLEVEYKTGQKGYQGKCNFKMLNMIAALASILVNAGTWTTWPMIVYAVGASMARCVRALTRAVENHVLMQSK